MKEYIDKFDDLLSKYDIQEEPISTIARFGSGLRLYVRNHMYSHHVTALEDAYHFALDLKQYLKEPLPISCPDRVEVFKCDYCEGYGNYIYHRL